MSQSGELFKNLPPIKAQATAPRKTPGGPAPKEPGEEVHEDPEEFPLGEDPDTAPPVIEPPVDPIEPTPDDQDTPDEENPQNPSAAAGRMNEIEMLKQRALLMGIKFSNNIGLDALRSKVRLRMEGEKAQEAAATLMTHTTREPKEMLPVKTDRQVMYEQEMRLVRLRITNLDPKKKDLPGEIFTVANEFLGAVKKFIPYGEATDNGYHVPYVIYRQLREREFLNIKTRKDRQGRTIVETSMAREFALEELPQLSQKELDRLAASQAASAGMSN